MSLGNHHTQFLKFQYCFLRLGAEHVTALNPTIRSVHRQWASYSGEGNIYPDVFEDSLKASLLSPNINVSDLLPVIPSNRGFCGSSVVKNPPAIAGHSGAVGSTPNPGGIPRAAEQLNPCAKTTEPVLESPGAETTKPTRHHYWSLCALEPVLRDERRAPARHSQRKVLTAKETQLSHK